MPGEEQVQIEEFAVSYILTQSHSLPGQGLKGIW